MFLLRSLCFCFIGKILVKKWHFGLYGFLCSLNTLHIRSISTDNPPVLTWLGTTTVIFPVLGSKQPFLSRLFSGKELRSSIIVTGAFKASPSCVTASFAVLSSFSSCCSITSSSVTFYLKSVRPLAFLRNLHYLSRQKEHLNHLSVRLIACRHLASAGFDLMLFCLYKSH